MYVTSENTTPFLYKIEFSLDELPFCNRDDALMQMLDHGFNQWLFSLSQSFLQLLGHKGSLLAKIPYSMALTARGMGKTRFLRSWAKEVLKKDFILINFVKQKTNYATEKPEASIYEEHADEEPITEEKFDWSIAPQLHLFEDKSACHENIARLFLWELRDAVLCNRVMGFSLDNEFENLKVDGKIMNEIFWSFFIFAICSISKGTIFHFVFKNRENIEN